MGTSTSKVSVSPAATAPSVKLPTTCALAGDRVGVSER